MTNIFIDINIIKDNKELSFKFNHDFSSGILGMMGPSGSGKTTLLKSIAGLDRNTFGKISLGDVIFQDKNKVFVNPNKRDFRLVFQEYNLFSHLNVKENLFFGRLRNKINNEHPKPEKIFNELDLISILDRKIQNLSGGEKQRIAIGRALLSYPKLLLMDESLNSLDKKIKDKVIKLLKHFSNDLKVPLIFTSHSFDQILELSDRLIILSKGSVLSYGETKETLSSKSIKKVIGEKRVSSIIEAEIINHDKKFNLTTLRKNSIMIQIPEIHYKIGDKVKLRLFAEDVAISLEKPKMISIRNIFSSKVVEITDEDGPFKLISLDIGGQKITARITKQSFEELDIINNNYVYALVKSAVIDKNYSD